MIIRLAASLRYLPAKLESSPTCKHLVPGAGNDTWSAFKGHRSPFRSWVVVPDFAVVLVDVFDVDVFAE